MWDAGIKIPLKLRILTIASILPVPGKLVENDYILQHMIRHEKAFNDDRFIIVRPSPYLPKIFKLLKIKVLKWEKKNAVSKIGSYNLGRYSVSILPYFSIGSNAALHCFLTASIIKINQNMIGEILGEKPDLIHAHYLFPDALLANFLSSKLNIPFILTLQEETRFFRNYISNFRARSILKNACFITTLSPKMKATLNEQGFRDSKILSLGIDERYFHSIKTDRKDSQIRFVTAANLVTVKNLSSVIKAFKLLNNRKDISYTIIGNGPEKNNLLDLAGKFDLKDEISFLPAIPNEMLADELVNYDVYIQPSFKETYGLSYFEALACGLPVILTENTGAYHFIREFNCYLTVDPYNVDDIANKISIAADREWISAASRDCKKAASTANWDNFVHEMAGLYQKCTKHEG